MGGCDKVLYSIICSWLQTEKSINQVPLVFQVFSPNLPKLLLIGLFPPVALKLIKAGGRIIQSEIHKLIISIWNKEEFPAEWKESVIVPIYKKGDKTDCSNY
jgi:hypothetical protein